MHINTYKHHKNTKDVFKYEQGDSHHNELITVVEFLFCLKEDMTLNTETK